MSADTLTAADLDAISDYWTLKDVDHPAHDRGYADPLRFGSIAAQVNRRMTMEDRWDALSGDEKDAEVDRHYATLATGASPEDAAYFSEFAEMYRFDPMFCVDCGVNVYALDEGERDYYCPWDATHRL